MVTYSTLCRYFFNRAFLPFVAFGLVSLGGCQNDKEKIIQEKVSERVADFRKKKSLECRQSLLAKAEHAVDSLLLAEAQQSLQDSLSKLRPFRPAQPPAIPAIDSNGIKPIFK